MYHLYLKDEGGNQILLGIFPGSRFWEGVAELAELMYGKDNVSYTWKSKTTEFDTAVEPHFNGN